MAAHRGFTLIELMVVIAIIAILATVGFVSFTNAQITGRDARRKQDLKGIQQALELYYQANNGYPGSAQCPSGCASDKQSSGWNSGFATALVGSGDINQLPIDPRNGQGSWNGGNGPYFFYDYAYGPGTPPGSYRLCTHLENANDKDINVVNGVNVNTGAPCDGSPGWKDINYELDSP